ncbi:hypothetical protein [Chitinophaga lutea]|nr:hypothetical protein [Chitinophaga lutea]
MEDMELFRSLINGARQTPATGSRSGGGGSSLIKYGESEALILISIAENGYLLHLNTEKVTYLDWFYGDATCGLISHDSKWAVMGGDDRFTVWKEDVCTKIDIKGVFDVRQIGEKTLQILIDPWCENAAIWELDIDSLKMKLGRPFSDYFNKVYTDNVVW